MDQAPRSTADGYSFVMEGIAEEQSEPLTLLRRSRRVLGDIDLDETSIPLSGGKCRFFYFLQVRGESDPFNQSEAHHC